MDPSGCVDSSGEPQEAGEIDQQAPHEIEMRAMLGPAYQKK